MGFRATYMGDILVPLGFEAEPASTGENMETCLSCTSNSRVDTNVDDESNIDDDLLTAIFPKLEDICTEIRLLRWQTPPPAEDAWAQQLNHLINLALQDFRWAFDGPFS
jgi:hypothetical protein